MLDSPGLDEASADRTAATPAASQWSRPCAADRRFRCTPRIPAGARWSSRHVALGLCRRRCRPCRTGASAWATWSCSSAHLGVCGSRRHSGGAVRFLQRSAATVTAQRDTVYWYAPFDNAGELSLARAISSKLSGSLVVQSCSSRFGEDLPGGDSEPFTLVRDLPPPAGENGEPRSRRGRLEVARERAVRRRRLIAATKPSLIHLHTYNPVTDWYDAPRLRRRGVPVVQSIHNVRPHDQQFPRPVETQLLKRGYRVFDRIIVAHEHLAARLVDEFGVDQRANRCRATTGQRRGLPCARSAPHAEEDVTTFLFFGTFRRNKGIVEYLSAIDALVDDPSLRFVFAGRGDADLEQAVLNHQPRSTDRGRDRLRLCPAARRALCRCRRGCDAVHRPACPEWCASRRLCKRSPSDRYRRRRARFGNQGGWHRVGSRSRRPGRISARSAFCG